MTETITSGSARRPWRTLLLTVTAALVLAGSLSACGSDDEPEGSAAAAAAATTANETPVKLAFFKPLANNAFVDAQTKGLEAAAKELGAEVQVYDGGGKPQTQFSQVQDALSSGGFQAMVVFGVDANALVPAIKDAVAKDISVVCLFSPCGPNPTATEPQVEGVVAQVGPSAAVEGKLLGDLTVRACENKDPCRVAFMYTFKTYPTDKERGRQMKAVIADHPNIEIVTEVEGESDANKSKSAMQDVLQAHPQVDVVTTAGDQMARGAQLAIEDANKAGQIAIIGNGASEIGVRAVRQGDWLGTGALLPYDEGYKAAELAIRAARGESGLPTSIEDHRDLSKVGDAVTKDNADDFEPQWAG